MSVEIHTLITPLTSRVTAINVSSTPSLDFLSINITSRISQKVRSLFERFAILRKEGFTLDDVQVHWEIKLDLYHLYLSFRDDFVSTVQGNKLRPPLYDYTARLFFKNVTHRIVIESSDYESENADLRDVYTSISSIDDTVELIRYLYDSNNVSFYEFIESHPLTWDSIDVNELIIESSQFDSKLAGILASYTNEDLFIASKDDLIYYWSDIVLPGSAEPLRVYKEESGIDSCYVVDRANGSTPTIYSFNNRIYIDTIGGIILIHEANLTISVDKYEYANTIDLDDPSYKYIYDTSAFYNIDYILVNVSHTYVFALAKYNSLEINRILKGLPVSVKGELHDIKQKLQVAKDKFDITVDNERFILTVRPWSTNLNNMILVIIFMCTIYAFKNKV